MVHCKPCFSPLPFMSILFLACVTGLEAQDPIQPSGRISGQVVARNGAPLADVVVRLEDRDSLVKSSTRTDQRGRFRFKTEKAASFLVSLEKEGFRSIARDVFLERGGRVEMAMVLLALIETVVSERIMVIGDASGITRLPGSAHYLDRLEGENLAFDDIHQLLRQVPGVNIQEEEGFGLRPNIGIRGTTSERSSNITLMEDGVLIAPAPYAAPAAYYFPVTGRMKAVEVRKGSSQIKYGPRTTGGALNLVSRDIPSRFEVNGSLGAGDHATGKAQLMAGNATARFGWLLQTYQLSTEGFKQLEQGANTGVRIGDYLAKVRFNSDVSASVYQQLELKLGTTSQESRETYLGLTEEDFERDPLRRYSASQRDRFDSDHEQFQLTYLIAPSDKLDITTSVYRNNFRRNWYKLQSVVGSDISEVLEDSDGFSNELAILKGADSREDALRVRANNRRYFSQGIQSVVGMRLDAGRSKNLLEIGFRYHQDQEDRFQHEDGFQMRGGRMVPTSSGTPGSQSNRIGDATAAAFFAQNTLERGRWRVTPGFRFEKISLLRTDFARDDPDRVTPAATRGNQVSVFIPGIGVSFDWRFDVQLFGGLHKGFSPPGPGSAEETQPELSLNYEGGLRWNRSGFELQAAGFFNDYSNLLGADTLASGGAGEGDSFNGGQARVWGTELSGSVDLLGSHLGAIRLPLRFAYTLTEGQFLQNFSSGFRPWDEVRAGDHIPYLARHQLFTGLSLQASRWRLNLNSSLGSRMRTAAGQGAISNLQGTDTQLLFGLSGEYDLKAEKQAVTLFISVQNLTNRAYIVARRPAGVRPGLPRTLMGGIRFNIGR